MPWLSGVRTFGQLATRADARVTERCIGQVIGWIVGQVIGQVIGWIVGQPLRILVDEGGAPGENRSRI